MGIDSASRKTKKKKPITGALDEKRGWVFDFVFFAAGSILLLFVFLFLGSVNSSVRSAKQILGVTSTGVDFLKQGNLQLAEVNFEQARKELRDSNEVLLQLVKSLPLGRDVQKIFAGSTRVIDALEFLNLGKNEFLDTRIVWDSAENSSDQQFYQSLKSTREYLVSGQIKLKEAISLLNTVDLDILPGEFRRQFFEVRNQILVTDQALEQVVSLQGFLLGLLGGEEKTYLLIFQNNNEARATGGFIGTYGILRFVNGRMKIEKIESIYNLDGQLRAKIAAPGPMQRQVSKLWGMRDANWFVDFPSSARKILEFAELAGAAQADGVISFTPDVFERLLALSGPIEMPEYLPAGEAGGEVLTPENFRAVTQYKTSIDYDKEINQPKKFLADFAPRLLQKLSGLPREQTLALANLLLAAISEKHLMMFSVDPDMQKAAVGFGVGGEIKRADGDYLAVFHSNLGGGKTDLNITQKVEKKVVLTSGGIGLVKLKITRMHTGGEEKFFPRNIDFMRVLVPAQAKLLSASGFDDAPVLPSARAGAITDSDLANWDARFERDDAAGMYVGNESGYTVFANWLELSPGETKTVELNYELNLLSEKTYTHLLQKQPGGRPFDFTLEINYLPGNIIYFYPEYLTRDGKKLVVTETVNTDKIYGLIGE